jgi:uncharacterized protein YbjT (DUF2867 family)
LYDVGTMKVLLFGATGSAGGSVLRACLSSPLVEDVRVITRRELALAHEKLRVIVHKDFLDFAGVEPMFAGVDACFFCLGVSVTQVPDEATYRLITHDFTLTAARALNAHSPNAAFHYISGQGTRADSRMMWARVKATTEQELMALSGAVCWRPALIDGEHSESGPRVYQLLLPVLRLLKPFRGLYVSGADLGRAMLQATAEHIRGRVIENAEIRALATRAAV